MLLKLYLLSWKNVLYFKRHYILTAVEIILPCLFAILLAYGKSDTAPPDDSGSRDYVDTNFPNYDYGANNHGEGRFSMPGDDDGANNPDPNDARFRDLAYDDSGSKVDTWFPEYNETAFLGALARRLNSPYFQKNMILYTPKSEAAERILGKFVEKMDDFLNLTTKNRMKRLKVNITDLPNEDRMIKFNYFNLIKAFHRAGNQEVFNIPFGLVFDGLSGNKVGPKVSYKIRMNGDFFNTTLLMNPRYHPALGYNDYIDSGFTGIQYLLDKILIEEYTNVPLSSDMFSLQAFPYPPYKTNNDSIIGPPGRPPLRPEEAISFLFSLLLVCGFVFIVPQVIRGVVSEKESGIKELMKMSGLPEWMHWLGWMLNSLAVLAVSVTIIVFLLCYPFNSRAGAVVGHSDPSLLFAVLMIYMIWTITYCFVISACFEKPTLAMTFGIIIWLVSYFSLGVGMRAFGKDFSAARKLLYCLFPNVAICLALDAIVAFEFGDPKTQKAGLKWGNINEIMEGSRHLPLLHVMLMFLVSICLNMIICLYLEAVLPKTYGVRKPFYFLCRPSEWRFGNRVSDGVLANDNDTAGNKKPGFEDDPPGVKPGVQIKNLRKEFGIGKVAVNDLTMNISKGQIFCFLGQNGAGKTTTMSILTGIISPTAGTAFIDGYDIRTNMSKIRRNLGLCPQQNMLFDKMTVMEQLRFFGMLRGLSSKNAMTEGKNLVRLLRMGEKQDVLSMKLSGGQKRRLQLGCALIGGSKVIFLDEPTSGLDPEARRAIWDILLDIRGERTIVLTTHFMEEADVLGDRIAILANGTLQCCGTSNFLKRFYGAGYTLNMTLTDGANREEILRTVCKHIEGAQFKASHSNNATELSIVLPSNSNITAKFPDLFSELRREQKRLAIDEIGVGWTTMDEVFVRVEELSHKAENANSGPTGQQNDTSPLGPNYDKLTGLKLTTNQFHGLLLKKLYLALRQKIILIIRLLIPVLLMIDAVSSGKHSQKTETQLPALKMSMSSYKNPVTLYFSEKKDLGDIYAKVVGSSAQQLDSSYNNNVSQGLLAAGLKNVTDYRYRHIVAAELKDTNMKGMYSVIAYHSAALSLNLLTNTFLQSKGTDYVVEITNHPFPGDIRSIVEFRPPIGDSLAIGVAVLLSMGLTLLFGSFVIGPVEERICQGKQLQLMTGVNPFLYWSSFFLWDMSLALISITLMTACIPFFEWESMLTDNYGAGVLFLLMTVYAIASILFSYIVSTFVKGVAGGFSLVTIVNIAACVILGLPSNYLENKSNFNPNKGLPLYFRMIGRLIPTYGFTKGSMDYVDTSIHNSFCYTIPKRSLELYCDPDLVTSADLSRIRRCCDNCAHFGKCLEARSYFRWTKEVNRSELVSPLQPPKITTYEIPALGQDLFLLIRMAAVYFVILMLIEYGVFQKLKRIFKLNLSNFRSTVDDSDVLEENERVSRLVMTSNSSEDAMVVDNLCKSYGSFAAVSKLSFGVHHGECFGLLGVNGAGKTTTFRMLTGDESRSKGNAYINNLSLSSKRKRFLNMLGYCPQFDGFIERLSGKEMLRLFARLRGIPGDRVEEEADKWLQMTGLTASANVQCRKYSGGMKRRLSTAMALIGDPVVILLDEPTSGVDPVSRRQFWKIITSVKNSGQAIILTSHSMEECEALCSRLGIMVNGEMQCLGGVQHLKNKFAQGYSLMLKLKEEALQEDENVVQAITKSILQNFEPSSLKDHHQTTMKFEINSPSLSWDELYGRMEGIKADFQEAIEEYAITETTLEEVFLSFARKQYVNERVTVKKGASNLLDGKDSSKTTANNSTTTVIP